MSERTEIEVEDASRLGRAVQPTREALFRVVETGTSSAHIGRCIR